MIVDSGPLAGLIRQRDQWHQWAKSEATHFEPPLLTCEAVISETCFLLRGEPRGNEKVLGLLSDGLVTITFSLDQEIEAIRTLMAKYADVPMSLADACLVRMSEQIENSAVFTVDRDFLIYRKQRHQKIPLISPF